MNNITYHQNGIGNEYGADGYLSNNWNPNEDYKNEYAKVYFRIDAKGYGYPSFNFEESERKAFYVEVKNALQPLGWEEEDEENEWGCGYIRKGKQHLYLHPQNFSGEVLKNEIKSIAEALKEHKTFSLRWVNLYDTVYDMTDIAYEEYLNSKDEEIRKELFDNYSTTRINKFYHTYDICTKLFSTFGLKRIGMNDGMNYANGQTMKHIENIIKDMITEGLLIGVIDDNRSLFRSLNKSEKKKLIRRKL